MLNTTRSIQYEEAKGYQALVALLLKLLESVVVCANRYVGKQRQMVL
jgi:hypothetical protein